MVGSDDGHTGKSAITTPQSASLTAPLTQGSPCHVPFSTRVPFTILLYKFQFACVLMTKREYVGIVNFSCVYGLFTENW